MTDPDPAGSDGDTSGSDRDTSGNDGDPAGSDRDPTDPGRIRSIAVHREDVASALEATLRTDREVVLRVTPPFSGRMRARLHSLAPAESGTSTPRPGSTTEPEPIRVDPRDLVEDIPDYPEVDETVAENPDADVETRRRLHGEAVEAWRKRVREAVVGSVTLDVDDGPVREVDDGPVREVDVNALG